ncbi:hypothetical protein [Agrobacterium rosae]
MRREPLTVRYANASALDLFRIDFDTCSIAAYFQITEAEAEKRLTLERSAARGLPDPYRQN